MPLTHGEYQAPLYIRVVGALRVRKRCLYAEPGVREYWRYDETGGEFYSELLVCGDWVLLTPRGGGFDSDD